MQCWNLSSWNSLLLQHGPEELLFWVLIMCWGLQERKEASNMEQPSCQGKKQMGSSQSYTDCLSQVLSQPILEMGKHGARARWKELVKLSSIITSTRPVKRQKRTAFQALWSLGSKTWLKVVKLLFPNAFRLSDNCPILPPVQPPWNTESIHRSTSHICGLGKALPRVRGTNRAGWRCPCPC